MTRSNETHSAYAGDKDDWKRFLTCWQHDVASGKGKALTSALQGKIKSADTDNTNTLLRLDAAEKRLGIKLPPSYRDFILAFDAVQASTDADLENHVGLFPIDRIGFMRDLSPDSVEFAAQFPSESEDASYFVYGVGQDDATMRSSYVANDILIGKYGRDSYETIVLYPQVMTKDGEMEAALGYHAGQFRSPSFAELMRQLGHLELTDVNTMPPYPQAQLKGTCADLLPLRDVWWP